MLLIVLPPLYFYVWYKGVKKHSKCNRRLIYGLLSTPVLLVAVLLSIDFPVSKKIIQEGLKSFGTSTKTSFGFLGSSTSTRPGWNSVSLLIPRFFDRLINDRDPQRNYSFNGPISHLLFLRYIQEARPVCYLFKKELQPGALAEQLA